MESSRKCGDKLPLAGLNDHWAAEIVQQDSDKKRKRPRELLGSAGKKRDPWLLGNSKGSLSRGHTKVLYEDWFQLYSPQLQNNKQIYQMNEIIKRIIIITNLRL